MTAALLCLPAPAAEAQVANGENARPRRWEVGLAPSYAYLVLEEKSQPRGAGSALFVRYGLADGVALFASGLWTGHDIEGSDGAPGGLYQMLNVAAGVCYAIDSLPISPSFEVGIGLLHRRFQGKTATDAALLFGLAAEYVFAGWLGVGAGFHYHAFLASPADYPVYFNAGPRITVKW